MPRKQKNISSVKQRHWAATLAALSRGLHATTRELARDYTRLYPQEVGGWVTLAIALTDLADYENAQAALRRGQKIAPRSVRHKFCYQWGTLHLQRGKYATAAKWYRQAIELSGPDSHGPYLVCLGVALRELGEMRAARHCYRRVIQLGDRLSDEAWYNLALLHRAQGNYAQALRCLDHALELDPSYAVAKSARVDVLRAQQLHTSLSRAAR